MMMPEPSQLPSAFFVDGALLFPSLESFTAICEAAGRKISTLKPEAMVLCHENSGLLALGEECRRELMGPSQVGLAVSLSVVVQGLHRICLSTLQPSPLVMSSG